MEITDVDSMNQEEPTEKIDITKLMLLTKRGKRSARHRRKNFATWIPLQGHLNSKIVLRTCRNDQVVGSKKMEYPHGGTRSWLVYKKRTAKGEKNIGGEGDANNQPITAVLDDTKGSGGDENAAEHVDVPESDTSSEVLKDNNRASADTVEQIDVLMADNSSEFKERGDADAFKQIGVPTSYTSAEIKQSSGANAISIVKTGVLMNNTFIDLKESNGAVANALMQITDAISLHQAKEKNAEIDPAVFSGLDPDTGAEKLDVSSTESALASLYGDSVPDSCVEFAVKLLMDETPLPAEAAEVEVFFGQKMNCNNSTIAGLSPSPLRWKN